MADVGIGSRGSDGSARAWVERWPDSEPPTSAAAAAVTLVLRDGNRDTEVLLIERTVREDDPASGQVALPGGHVDDSDPSLRATALRELLEEVGLGSRDVDHPVRFVGIERANVFGIDVGVFATLLAGTPGPTVASPGEVAHVFWLPSDSLVRLEDVERATRLGPRTVPAVLHQGHVVWGFTLRILRDFFGAGPPETR